MPGAFSGISIASSALAAFQRALDVTGHNVANVNTKGYSRQTIQMGATTPGYFYSNGKQALGTGVNVDAVARAQDIFSQMRMQTAMANLGRSSTLASNMKQVEGIFQEPSDNGISNALDKMYNAMSALSSSPNDSGAKWNLRNAAQTFTARVRDTYARLKDQSDTTAGMVKDTIARINDLGQNISALNVQISREVAAGSVPNDLMDQRDSLLQNLSQLTDITTVPQKNGAVNVYISNFGLVTDAQSTDLPDTFDASTQTITNGSQTIPIRGGELLGHMQTMQRLDSAMADLDTFANEMRTQFNTLYQTGTNSTGVTGLNFFKDAVPQTGAVDLSLTDEILADPSAITPGTSGDSGDGGLMHQLAELRNAKLSTIGNKTLGQFYSDTVTTMGQETAFYTSQMNTQTAVVQQVQAQIDTVSGVSLDDEMADMMKFQRSYQAAAHVLSIMSQVTDDLINLIR